ncbi:MAG: NUDIX domain-containing protein [Anaerolineales bacterium]|nr:NUDIX domain-containing protein [Anaerolineales bacterium]
MPPDETNLPHEGPLVKIIDQVEDYSFGGLFRVVKARLEYRKFDGQWSREITRINFERGDSVGVLLYDPGRDEVVLVRQFRYPVYAGLDPEAARGEGSRQAWLLELVAGIIDPGASAVASASQELLEEAGYMVQGALHPIASIYPSPGGSSERIDLFFGLVAQKDRVSAGGGLEQRGEDIQVETVPFKEAMQMVEQGEICDAKTVIALQHLALRKLRGV